MTHILVISQRLTVLTDVGKFTNLSCIFQYISDKLYRKLQIHATKSHANTSQKADDYSMIWKYKIRYDGENYHQ